MKILFTPPYDTSLLFETDDMALFQQISKATLVKSEGYGKDKRYFQSEDEPTIDLLPASTEVKKKTQEDEIAKLKKELEEKRASWMAEYNKKTEVEAKLKEANAKLELALSLTKPKCIEQDATTE